MQTPVDPHLLRCAHKTLFTSFESLTYNGDQTNEPMQIIGAGRGSTILRPYFFREGSILNVKVLSETYAPDSNLSDFQQVIGLSLSPAPGAPGTGFGTGIWSGVVRGNEEDFFYAEANFRIHFVETANPGTEFETDGVIIQTSGLWEMNIQPGTRATAHPFEGSLVNPEMPYAVFLQVAHVGMMTPHVSRIRCVEFTEIPSPPI